MIYSSNLVDCQIIALEAAECFLMTSRQPYWCIHFRVTLCLFQNESVLNLSLKNEFDLHENDDVGGTRFHTNGFGFKWQNPTRKWSIKRRPCWFPTQFLNFKLVT